MPVDIGSLSSEDRQDLERRLGLYGLDSSALQEPLAITSSSRVPLAYGPSRETARQPHVIQTTDIEAVKRMVGIDNRIAKTAASRVALPGRIDLGRTARTATLGRTFSDSSGRQQEPQRGYYSAAPGLPMHDPASPAAKISQADLASMDSESLTNVRIAAKAFVRGNSEVVASYRPVIEAAIGVVIIPIWAVLKVTVASGSVLEFGPGVNVLVAYEIEIEPGGIVRSHGHLTINCTKLTKTSSMIAKLKTPFVGAFKPMFSAE
jgi:hypothetical protein